MRYLIIGVCIILAAVALMPVLMTIGKNLQAYFTSAVNYENDVKEVEEETEELTMEGKDNKINEKSND